VARKFRRERPLWRSECAVIPPNGTRRGGFPIRLKMIPRDELLRDALRSLDAEDDELRAIQEGIDSVDRGDDAVSAEDSFQQLRAKHQ
jgi:hypothetical protein